MYLDAAARLSETRFAAGEGIGVRLLTETGAGNLGSEARLSRHLNLSPAPWFAIAWWIRVARRSRQAEIQWVNFHLGGA